MKCRIAYPRVFITLIGFSVGLLLLVADRRLVAVGEGERWLFSSLSRAEEVRGEGITANPWQVDEFGKKVSEPAKVLVFDDDPDGYFETVPPPPADLAVLLARLDSAGVQVVAFSQPLQWSDPDLLAVETLRRVLDRFDKAVLGFPLKDGTTGGPVVAPFQVASVAYDSVSGDASKLPVVNSIQGDNPELGGEKTTAGFTTLRTEQSDEQRAYLLARWDDRVVFSHVLVAELANRGLSETDIQIEVGKEIRLGDDGPRVPIDFRGRVSLRGFARSGDQNPASAVIAGTLEESYFNRKEPVYFIDQRSALGKEELESNQILPLMVAAVRAAPQKVSVETVASVPIWVQLIVLFIVAGCCARFVFTGSQKTKFWRSLISLLVITGGLIVVFHLGFAPMALPFLAVPITSALLASQVVRRDGSEPIRLDARTSSAIVPAPLVPPPSITALQIHTSSAVRKTHYTKPVRAAPRPPATDSQRLSIRTMPVSRRGEVDRPDAQIESNQDE